MIVTIDTNIIVGACNTKTLDHLRLLLLIEGDKSHGIGADYEGAILGEYERNCRRDELYRK